MRSRLLLAAIGFVAGAALSYRAALMAEALAVHGGWRTPGLIVFFHLLPVVDRGGEPLLWLFRVPIAIDVLILFSVICALVVLISTVYRFYNS